MNIKEIIDKIGGRERLESIVYAMGAEPCDADPILDSVTHGDIGKMARALLAVLDAQEKPFMYAISDCDGQAHFDETCVSAHRCDLEDVVGSLNEFRDDVDDGYSIVPVYTVTPAARVPDGWKLVPVDATRLMIDAAMAVEEEGYDAMLKAMIAAAPVQENKK